MSREEIEPGKQWVEQRLNQYSKTLRVPLERLEWREGNDYFENDRLSLAFYVNAKRHIQKLNIDDLMDVATDKSVQVKLDNLLNKLVESFIVKPKTIGFQVK